MYTHTPHAKVVFVAPSLSQIAANRFLKMTMTNDFAKGLILLALKTIKILGGGGGSNGDFCLFLRTSGRCLIWDFHKGEICTAVKDFNYAFDASTKNSTA